MFFFATASRPVLGSHPASYPMSPGGSSPGGEADHSPPSNAEVKNAWNYTTTHPYVFAAWFLVKHRNNFSVFVLVLTFSPHHLVIKHPQSVFFP